MLWKKMSSGLDGIVPPPSMDPLVVTPANSVVAGQEFSFSWTSNNSIGVTWEVNEIVGNVIGNIIYSGSGNSTGSTGNLIAPVTDSGNLISLTATAEGNPGADPLFAGQQTLYNVIPASGDPYYANVVLLLHGDGVDGGTTFVDNSQYNRTPAFTDRVTTSNNQTLFGQNTIYSLGNRYPGSILNYSSNIAFAQTDNFTLEFWIYPIAQPRTLGYLFGKDTITYMNYFGGSLSETGWSDTGPNDYVIPENDWTYIAISVVEQPLTPGFPIFRFYVNGVRQTEQFVTTNYANVPRDLGIVNIPGRDDLDSFAGYLSEIRYTQGVGRYTTSTIPIQSAPWPNN